MTDIEICQLATPYLGRRNLQGVGSASRKARRPGDFTRNFTMTIEILYLTAQIQSWLNMRVARHLAAQAEKIAR
jgi:hypothetical protein